MDDRKILLLILASLMLNIKCWHYILVLLVFSLRLNKLTAMLNLFEDWISKTKEKGNKRIGIGKFYYLSLSFSPFDSLPFLLFNNANRTCCWICWAQTLILPYLTPPGKLWRPLNRLSSICRFSYKIFRCKQLDWKEVEWVIDICRKNTIK